MKRVFSRLLCLAVGTLFFAGCGGSSDKKATASVSVKPSSPSSVDNTIPPAPQPADQPVAPTANQPDQPTQPVGPVAPTVPQPAPVAPVANNQPPIFKELKDQGISISPDTTDVTGEKAAALVEPLKKELLSHKEAYSVIYTGDRTFYYDAQGKRLLLSQDVRENLENLKIQNEILDYSKKLGISIESTYDPTFYWPIVKPKLQAIDSQLRSRTKSIRQIQIANSTEYLIGGGSGILLIDDRADLTTIKAAIKQCDQVTPFIAAASGLQVRAEYSTIRGGYAAQYETLSLLTPQAKKISELAKTYGIKTFEVRDGFTLSCRFQTYEEGHIITLFSFDQDEVSKRTCVPPTLVHELEESLQFQKETGIKVTEDENAGASSFIAVVPRQKSLNYVFKLKDILATKTDKIKRVHFEMYSEKPSFSGGELRIHSSMELNDVRGFISGL
jgi:hypothetical protein